MTEIVCAPQRTRRVISFVDTVAGSSIDCSLGVRILLSNGIVERLRRVFGGSQGYKRYKRHYRCLTRLKMLGGA